MDDLLAWTPDTSYKSRTNLNFELTTKIFNAPADRLFAAMHFDFFGWKMIGRLVEFYGNKTLWKEQRVFAE